MNVLAEVKKRRPWVCRNCGNTGHTKRTCTVVKAAPDPVGEAAQLREHIDALKAETAEYKRVRAWLDERIAENAIAVVQAESALADARRRR